MSRQETIKQFLEKPELFAFGGTLLFFASIAAYFGMVPSGHFLLSPLAYAAFGAFCVGVGLRQATKQGGGVDV